MRFTVSRKIAQGYLRMSSIADMTNQALNTQQMETEQLELATAKNQVTARVQEVAQSAAQASDAARQADHKAEDGKRAVSEVSEVSAAEEQGTVSEEINRNVASVHTLTNQTSEYAQQTAVASEELSRIATELDGMVGHFRV